jgi:hypothetical protein
MEIAFFTSGAGILVFFVYKYVTAGDKDVTPRHTKGRYDPVDHVFTAVSGVFDFSLRVIMRAYAALQKAFAQARTERRRADEETRDEKSKNRGAASFYLKKMSAHKKAIREEAEKTFDERM